MPHSPLFFVSEGHITILWHMLQLHPPVHGEMKRQQDQPAQAVGVDTASSNGDYTEGLSFGQVEYNMVFEQVINI